MKEMYQRLSVLAMRKKSIPFIKRDLSKKFFIPENRDTVIQEFLNTSPSEHQRLINFWSNQS